MTSADWTRAPGRMHRHVALITAVLCAAVSLPAQGVANGHAWRVTARGDSVQFDTTTVVLRSGAHLMVERGTLRVPEVRHIDGVAAPSRRIALRWLRYAGTSAGPRAPIVFLAGGPGDAGTRAVGTMPPPLLDSLLAIGDLIAFDQRGTGTSDLLPPCPPGAPVPLDVAPSRAERDERAREEARRCLAVLAEQRVARAGWTTAESAADLESVRVALGAPKVSLFGGSYGTHLGLAYLQAFPTRVHRAVLAGVEGPDDTFKLPSRVDAVFADVARAADTMTVFAGRPPLLAQFDVVRQILDSAPPLLTVGTTAVRVNGFDLQRFVADALGDHRSISQLPAQLHAMASGDFTLLARSVVRARLPRPVRAMNLLMNCASGASNTRWAQIDRERGTSRLGDVMDYPAVVQCRMNELRAPGAGPSRVTAAPVLFVSGTWDGRTPPANVEALRAHYAGGRHLVVQYLSHNLMGDPLVMSSTLQFLRGLDVPDALIRRPLPVMLPQ